MWENIQIESTCIETSTDKAVLINMPKKSKYKGYCFWHPAKCCRLVGKNNYLIQISFRSVFLGAAVFTLLQVILFLNLGKIRES